MATASSLTLCEEVLLLALHDEKGTINAGVPYTYALGGAVLAELLMHHRIRIVNEKKKLVELVSPRPLGDPLLDDCLAKIAAAKRRASLNTWVSRIAMMKRLKHRVAEGLCRRGILRTGEDKVLLLFTRKVYPELDPKPERALVGRLHRALFTETSDVDPRTVVLISLAHSAELLRAVFESKDLKKRKDRIARLVNGEITGKATAQAIQAMRAAVAVACVLPAITAATSSH